MKKKEAKLRKPYSRAFAVDPGINTVFAFFVVRSLFQGDSIGNDCAGILFNRIANQVLHASE
jgi:hypothetical protein